MSMPSPLRVLLLLMLITALLISLHIWARGAILVYEAYQFATWLEEVLDR